jgi:hypothetical protein
MGTSKNTRETYAKIVEREEVFETETTISFTYEVDKEYRKIVDSMAKAIWEHDHGTNGGLFPTGDEHVDSPYKCRADDALRYALPLLRKKIADEIRNAV